MKPFVFKAGGRWFAGLPSRPPVGWDTWREALDFAFTVARVRHVAAESMREL